MAEQAGQLLVVRKRMTLPVGITPVDTGLTQVNLGVSPDPPLDGSDPTFDTAGVPSRVQVTPLAPLPPWVTGNIHHSEPYVDATTGTVWVDFWVDPDAGEQEVNVEFWDPHTAICPIDCDPYNVFTCTEPTVAEDEAEIGFAGPPATMTNNASTGQTLVVYVTVRLNDSYDPANVIAPDDAGWTTLGTSSVDLGGGAGLLFGAFVRVAEAGDPATYDFSWTAAVDQAWQLISALVTGADRTDPVQADAPVVANAVPATPFPLTAPSLTAVAPLPVLLVFYVCNASGGTWTPPAGVTAMGVFELGADLAALLGTQVIAAAGATGAKTASYDVGSDGGFAYGLLLAQDCGIFPGPTPDIMGV